MMTRKTFIAILSSSLLGTLKKRAKLYVNCNILWISLSFSAPTLSASSSTITRRWTPFANIAPPEQSKSFLSTSTSSLNSTSATRSFTMSAMDSSVTSNTNRSQTEPIQSTSSFSSLTDIVKNAMNKKPSATNVQPVRRPVCGTTLSTKDLNHLSPQSAWNWRFIKHVFYLFICQIKPNSLLRPYPYFSLALVAFHMLTNKFYFFVLCWFYSLF